MRLMHIVEEEKPGRYKHERQVKTDRATRAWELSKWGDIKVRPDDDPLRAYFHVMFLDAFKDYPREILSYEANHHNLGVGGNSILDSDSNVDQQFDDIIGDETPEGWYNIIESWGKFLHQIDDRLDQMRARIKKFNSFLGEKDVDPHKVMKAYKDATRGFSVVSGSGKRLSVPFSYSPIGTPNDDDIKVVADGKELKVGDPLVQTWRYLKSSESHSGGSGWLNILDGFPKWWKFRDDPGREMTQDDLETFGLDRNLKKKVLMIKAKDFLAKAGLRSRIDKNSLAATNVGPARYLSLSVSHDFGEPTSLELFVEFPQSDVEWGDKIKNLAVQEGFKHEGREETTLRRPGRRTELYQDLYTYKESK